MITAQGIILYAFLFIGIYFQIFIVATYVANRRKIRAQERLPVAKKSPSDYPSATIIVPCYNEEKTVGKTIESLVALDYPAGKLRVSVVDDGSADGTWKVVQEYAKRYPGIVESHHKENGGKYTALNYAISRAATTLIGCLDADSVVAPNALQKMVPYFGNLSAPIGNPGALVVAVTPAMKIHQPQTFAQVAQSIEYLIGILIKKAQALLGAIHVTPGPFSLFRRDLFDKIGLFRHAHNTEDMEMAFRIQSNYLQIENAHDAFVYTTGPTSIKKLYKQRVRWTSGFLLNLRDYRRLLLHPKYGNMAMFTAPLGLALIFSAVLSALFLFYKIGLMLWQWSIRLRTVGFLIPHFSWSWFFVSTKAYLLLIVFIYALMIAMIIEAHALAGERKRFSAAVIPYFLIFSLISPLWLMKSVYNASLSQTPSWQRERALATPVSGEAE